MKGPNLASMAWRNLWRNRRRTLLTLSSIGFGTMLAILFTALGDSNFAEMIDVAARLGGGHVALQHREYLDSPTIGRAVPDAERLAAIAARDPGVSRAVPRIAGFLMVASAAGNQGAAFVAFDPTKEDTDTLSLLEALSEGSWFDSADARGIVLGGRLAESLDVGLGDKVVFTLTDRDGEIVQEASRIVGVVRTGAPSVDAGLTLLSIGRVRDALRYEGGEATQVAVFLHDQRASDEVAARLRAALAAENDPVATGDVVALPWHELQPDLAGFIAMKVASARFMETLIMLLVAAGIFNTLFVSVMERVREFGIMLALGFSPGSLFGLVMCESLWLGLVGLGVAGLMTAGPYSYLNRVGLDLTGQMGLEGSEVAGVAVSPVMYADIYPENAVVIACAALAATLLSGLYPAWKAGRVEPVESIRLD